MEKYFNKFPSIYYNGNQCKDITRRVKINEKLKSGISLFNPLEMNAGMRPDHLAEAYYEDPELDWMVYLANEIVDPYFGWYLDEQDFDRYIVDKYGSIENAIEHVKFYRNNWAQDDTHISVGFYENNLPEEEKAYWSPIYGQGARIIEYQRKREDWVQNTNRIIQYETFGANTVFITGEIVDIIVGGNPVGGGECISSNDTHLIIQHVTGNTIANTTWTKTLLGETSNNASVTSNASLILSENISNAESKYWRSVSWYDWEIEQNESKKILQVIDQNLVFDLAESMRLALKE
jgi:hypothetical protein